MEGEVLIADEKSRGATVMNMLLRVQRRVKILAEVTHVRQHGREEEKQTEKSTLAFFL